jgi:hypothetical protein
MKRLNSRWKTVLGSAWLTLTAGAVATGCGARITADGTGVCATDPTACAPISAVAAEEPGENCPTGGVAIRNGRDLDGDGAISDDEVLSVAYVCNGANGENGAAGENGAPGVDGEAGVAGEDGKSPEVTTAAASEEQCPHGGFVVTVDGVDTILCNGAPGANGEDGEDGQDGVDGQTPTVVITDATTEQCPAGGTVITINEIASVICNGRDGQNGLDGTAPSVSIAEATEESCAHGGVALTVDGATTFVCNGAPGADGRSPIVSVTAADGEQCAHGGAVISVDDNETLVCNGAPGAVGPTGRSPVVSVAPANEEQCLHGGVTLTVDENVTNICNGADGADGANGADGLSPSISVTPATEAQCFYGGSVVTIDTSITVLCNGAPGATGATGANGAAGADGQDGADGHTPVVSVTPATEAQCTYGGTVIAIDALASVICNGAPGATGATGATGDQGATGADGQDGVSPTVSVSSATLAQCPYGGALLTVNGASSAICNGAPGADGANGANGEDGADGVSPTVSVTGATLGQCANGGSVITVNGSQTIICNGTNGTNGANGANGATPVVTVTAATSGQCPTGGVVLAVDSVVDSSTVICNGTTGTTGTTGSSGSDGTDGSNGHSALVTEVLSSAATAECPNGTRTIKLGIDDGTGAGSTADNNVLEAGEVRASFTVCQAAATPTCGDGTCNGTETSATCAEDCAAPTNVGGSGTEPNGGEVFSFGTIKDLEQFGDGSLSPTGNITVVENDYLWVVNTADSSVSKWDAQTKTEIARYKVGLMAHECDGLCCHNDGCNMPSRVVMDGNGDPYVASRGFGIQGTVTKIAADLGDCVDRNGNGQIDTSTSATPLGWDANTGDHLDECVLWNKPVGPIGALLRSIAIDRGDATHPNGYVWVGSYGYGIVWRLNPQTGDYTEAPGQTGISLPAGFQPYGAVVMPDNKIYWTTLGGSSIARVDAATLTADPSTISINGSIYGSTADSLGRIWGTSGGGITSYDPATGHMATGFIEGAVSSGVTSDADGNLIAATHRNGTVQFARWPASSFDSNFADVTPSVTYFDTMVPESNYRSAVGVDRSGAWWTTNVGTVWGGSGQDQLVRYNPVTQTATTYTGPNDVYSYSDFTGSVRRAATKQGSWEGVYEVSCANAQFNNFNLYGTYPAGSTTTVSVRRAATQAALASASAVQVATVPANASPYALGSLLTAAGQTSGAWVKLSIVLKQGAGGETPIASGFRFNWTCPAP